MSLNILSDEVLTLIKRSGATLLGTALTVTALAGCARGPSPVGGELTRNAGVHDLSGKPVDLKMGTFVTVFCATGVGEPGTTFRAQVDSGAYRGEMVKDVRREDLKNTTDPNQASQQDPPQDPFGPIPPCEN